MRRIISILLENEFGALSRVVGLFAQRGYNIDSLTVAPTDDASFCCLASALRFIFLALLLLFVLGVPSDLLSTTFTCGRRVRSQLGK